METYLRRNMRKPLSHLFLHIRTYGKEHHALYVVAITFFFFRIFDGVLSYAVPLLIIERGFSETQMGFIIGFSSLAGAVFDIGLARVLRRVSYRKLFLFVFIAALFYALTLWGAKELIVFLLAMALWGIYFDFMNFGTYNFISRVMKPAEHSSSFGVLDIFKSLGYLIAPIFSGMVIFETVKSPTFILALMFLAMGFVFYLLLLSEKDTVVVSTPRRKGSILEELRIWRKIFKPLYPVLLMTFAMNIGDSFFWTVGPLISERMTSIHPLGGFLITLYFLPSLLTGWFVGRVTSRYGKKRTAIVSFLFGSIILSTGYFAGFSPILLLIVFASSTLSAIAWPAMNGAYADYIAETPELEPSIEGLSDFVYNLSYVVGPILAGIMADHFGESGALAFSGGVGIVISLILIKITPRHIHLQSKV